MGFQASIYGLNFCHYFLNFLFKIEKKILSSYEFFFSIGDQEQKLCPNKLKTRKGGNKKKLKFWKTILEFFSHRLYFCLHVKLWFIPFVMRKLWTILFFRPLKHLLEKITCRIYFWMQFLQFNIKIVPHGLVCFLEQSHHWN